MLQVDPNRTLKAIASAAKKEMAGAIIEVDAGNCVSGVAVWQRDNITLRAVAGRVRLLAQGAAVPNRNGAGLRRDSGSLLVKNCRIRYNETGLPTNKDPNTVLEEYDSDFAYDQHTDELHHNLNAGQMVMSHIINSRQVDRDGDTASCERERPNCGMAFVVDNTIAQSWRTENRHLISFGAEGYKWPQNSLYLVNPILPNGVFLRVAPGADAGHELDNVLLGPWAGIRHCGAAGCGNP